MSVVQSRAQGDKGKEEGQSTVFLRKAALTTERRSFMEKCLVRVKRSKKEMVAS